MGGVLFGPNAANDATHDGLFHVVFALHGGHVVCCPLVWA